MVVRNYDYEEKTMKNENKSLEEMLQDAANGKDIKNKEKSEHTAQDLRKQVLAHGVHMIEKLQKSIYNKDEDISAEQARSYEMLWPVLENLIDKTEDLKVIQATNATEVIGAVTAGKMTMNEGLAMMALLKDQITIEELPKLLEQLGDLEEK